MQLEMLLQIGNVILPEPNPVLGTSSALPNISADKKIKTVAGIPCWVSFKSAILVVSPDQVGKIVWSFL